MSINSGATYTTSRTVTLALTSNTATQMRFSNDATQWSAWAPFSTIGSFQFTPGEGLRTAYVEFMDAGGATLRVFDDITLDTVRPVATLDIDNGRTSTNQSSVSLTITPSEMPVQQAITVVAVTSTTPSTPGTFNAFASPTTVAIGTSTTARKICVWLRDAAGNVSASPAIYIIAYDASAPTVVSIAPGNGATGVTRDIRPIITFSEAMDPTSFTTANISIAGVSASTSALSESSGTRAQLTPSTSLAPNTSYTVTVTGVRDAAGNTMSGTSTATFTTGEFGAVSGFSAPLSRLVTATGSSRTLVVAETTGSTTEVRASVFDGTQWNSTKLADGHSVQAAAQGDSFVVAWDGLGPVAGSTSRYAGGQWMHGLPPPNGRLVSSPQGVLSVSGFSQSFPYSFEVSVLDGGTWVPTDGGAGSVVVQTPAYDSNDAGFAIVYGRWVSGSNYAVHVNHHDGTAWRTATLGGGMGFPGNFQVAGGGNSFLACWSAGAASSGCNMLDPATGTWTPRMRPNGTLSITGNDQGFALASFVSPTAIIETSNGQTWQPGSLSVAASSAPSVAARPGGFVAAWSDGDSLRASTFDGTSWSSTTTLATGSASAPLRIASVKSVGVVTIVTWLSDFDVFARTFDGTSWSSTVTVNSLERASEPSISSHGNQPMVVWAEGAEVKSRRWQGMSFAAATSVSTSPLLGPADEPRVAFDGTGRGLAVWRQEHGGRRCVFGASFDGTTWSAPFRIAANAVSPSVAFGASRFVVAWVEFVSSPADRVKAATFTFGSGLGAAVELSTQRASGDVAVTNGPGGFLAAFHLFQPAATLVSSLSADGVTWSTPVVIEATGRSDVAVAPAGNRFVAGSSTWTGTAYESRLRSWNGTAWSAETTMPGPCKLAGGASGAAAICASNASFSAAVFNLTSWATTSFGTWSSYSYAIAAGPAGRYRAMFADRTATFATGAWSTTSSVGSSGTDVLVSDGTEYFGAGVLQDTAYVQNFVAARSTSGVMSTLGPVESFSGEVWSGTAGHSGAAFFALWSQDERPSALGNRRIYARRW